MPRGVVGTMQYWRQDWRQRRKLATTDFATAVPQAAARPAE
jgi:hypothetical protein